MSSITKKFVSIVTALTVSVWLVGPSAAGAVTVDELLAQITALQAQLVQLQTQQQTPSAGGPAACSGVSFNRNLKQGMSGTDVKCLQALLNQGADTQVSASGVGSAGNETTFFGAKTKTAVAKFQEKYAAEVLTPVGLSAGTGFVGAKTREKLTALVGAAPAPTPTPTPTPTPGAGENKVSLAADTPAARSVGKGAQGLLFAKANFCAASQANTVSQVVLTRTGVAADGDLSGVKLYDGLTQVGSTQSLLTTTHKATFPSLNWTIPANSCKVLTIKANVATGATQGNSPKLAINAASDITSTVALDGVFPLESNAMTIAGISVGTLNLSTTTPSGTVVAGGKDQGVAGFRVTASSTEGIKLTSIKLTEVGSSVDSDLSNIKLFYSSNQLGSTVTALTNGVAVFDLSAAPLEVLGGNSKDLIVYVDVGMSIGIKDRTIQFEVTDNTNVEAAGTNSGGTVVVFGNAWVTTNENWPQRAASITINLGSLTVAQDSSYAPSSQSYTRGTKTNLVNAFKFTGGANEDVRITYIKLKSATGTSLADSDVSNVGLYDTAGNLVAGPVGLVSGFATFGNYTTGVYDATGIIDIPKSTSKTLIVKTDIPSGASTGTNFLGFTINNPTQDVKADGIASQNDIPTGSINAGSTTAVPSTALLHGIIEKGTLTVAANPGTPAAANYAVGTSNLTFAKFDLTSTGEDIKVTQFNVLFATSTAGNATTTVADAADVNNIKLYDGDSLLAQDAQVSSGYAEFAINATVPKNGTKTLTVVGDVPTGSDAGGLQAWLEKAGNVTASGNSSGVTITTTAASWTGVKGNVMTKGAPVLTVQAATTPATQTYIKNAASVEVLNILLTATPTEDIKVTRIKIVADATSTATGTAGTATTTFSQSDRSGAATGLGLTGQLVRDFVANARLFVGTTQVGTTQPTFTDDTNNDYVDFTGLDLVVPKGTTKVLTVKVDVINSTTTPTTGPAFFFGIATTTAASVDISGSGIQSGTAATIAIAIGGIESRPMYFGDSGTLTVALDAGTPNSAIVIEQTVGQMGKWRFTAANESVKISKLKFDVHHSQATSGTVLIPAVRIHQMATSAAGGQQYAFQYSIDGAATATCFFRFIHSPKNNATPTDQFVNAINSATSTCFSSGAGSTSGIAAYSATTSAGAVTLYASPAGQAISITDYPNPYGGGGNASNTFLANLRYGNTETVGRYGGANANVVAGKVALWDGTTKVAESALVDSTVTFNLPSGSEIAVPKGAKTLALTAEISDYIGAVEGSTIFFSLGTSTINASDTDYITAVGGSSGSSIGNGSITLDAEKAANEMWIYSTYPKLSLNASSPSGAQTVGTNKEVFRFDVQNPNASIDLDVNAVRFTLSTNASSAITDKTFNLYRSTDLNTVIGAGVSWANGTSTAVTALVTIYPHRDNTVAGGTTSTYVLKADTSSMNEGSAKTELLTVSIEDQELFWDDTNTIDGARSANQKVIGMPATGGTLSF